ncbi:MULTISPECIES: hypothetical protein [Carboxydocella]|uniref:Uncharacterized protein n=2 Tax=Carboxydocella TaxID=178898 RepID=A0A1T4RIK1_9FIRM|nr:MULTISPECIES: hypothetical protein [Carboxydocella]AVX20798.1 hypothetical protein CFE_1623 [Carboxydocella thermautotrophica]AVX31217.1 hypothetical protein CTH_1641 [Carboxydocella thermautotrophica]SKA15783.1 hypothetical protein SAMN02745885_02136 [Carboxydocella sporoproducens DSM 16521]GAW30029.1 hypothetical protein ULO1_25990 [Carboxydocella sp. ULO1]GAW32102.1 hypothetical protein JDF658_18670 [Carboxydocella sp. JDF658]
MALAFVRQNRASMGKRKQKKKSRVLFGLVYLISGLVLISVHLLMRLQ